MLKLTRREKSSLILEGILTIILLGLLNLAVLTILQILMVNQPGVNLGFFVMQQSVAVGPIRMRIVGAQQILVILMLVADFVILWWRMVRRYHQYQMDHIISELHYIAQGHLDHRIPFSVKGVQQHVITSVNALVDSTVRSMKEEREIEKSKDELITNVSHDLRTPLTSIIGYLGLIENHQYRSEEEIVQFANIAYNKAQQMKSMVDDLFEYTKVQFNAEKPKFVEVDLTQLLEQVSASFELEAEKHGIQMQTDFAQSPLMVEVVPDKIGRVFSNLVSNALKYGDGSTYVRIATRVKDDQVDITVANDGVPISEESVQHLFERFYRVESSRSKQTGGTGLGLAIVQSIIETHHGHVGVKSDESATTFTVSIPLQQPKDQQAH
ncbi:GHKL domain-containing protein [Limosilactobacillus gastricus]|uniref:histidine kinase n=1 Tax=Limosilactobacillus gastricus DSM 16045 TaxID=1423749 RepID=A0A0R1VA62_9LACO|nr:HAMP domain-containing sensor histidine kinase [Limosilactobacillus gastricus]KRM02362.1 Sensor histidine kinase [Limosilactobacillus gastricus DSM 16045]QGF39736.1 GHKL domain-containing protein [Limosilactobacillus gastricus]